MKYLKERETTKREEFAAELANEQVLFEYERPTKVEKIRNDIDRKIHETTKKMRDVREFEDNGYNIPEAEYDKDGKMDQMKQMEKLKARYRRPEHDRNLNQFFGNQEWEV